MVHLEFDKSVSTSMAGSFSQWKSQTNRTAEVKFADVAGLDQAKAAAWHFRNFAMAKKKSKNQGLQKGRKIWKDQ